LTILHPLTKLYLSFTHNTEEIEENFNNMMMRIIKKKTKEGSNEVRAQHVMRLAAEKIHGAFRELNRESVVTTSEFVKLVMQEALTNLIELLYDSSSSKFTFPFYIRDHTRKDAGVSKVYEALGMTSGSNP
jgi:hypothetical protein